MQQRKCPFGGGEPRVLIALITVDLSGEPYATLSMQGVDGVHIGGEDVVINQREVRCTFGGHGPSLGQQPARDGRWLWFGCGLARAKNDDGGEHAHRHQANCGS